MKITPIKNALLSVTNKNQLIELAQALIEHGVTLISTGGTSEMLQQAGISHQQVNEVTGFPEIFEGRVKTLHPKIQGGILGKRDKHQQEAEKNGIAWIDLVVTNFYPFTEALKQKLSHEEMIENIDIGGPTMVRAAAKNHAWTTVVTDIADYDALLNELKQYQGTTLPFRTKLAAKAFALTAKYDAIVYDYFHQKVNTSIDYPDQLQLQFTKHLSLRYGENPHQTACAYRYQEDATGVFAAKQHQGKPLSYNNLLDTDAALNCVREFEAPSCVIVKHANPCGVATAETIEEAYQLAYQADPMSAFGGIIALNRVCSASVAETLLKQFAEVIIAPGYTEEALAFLDAKPNLRVLELSLDKHQAHEFRLINGGLLWQQKDSHLPAAEELQIVTKIKPTAEEMNSLLFAWRVVKHVKSNAIVIAKNNVTVGIGAGQVSRIDAVDIAVRKAGDQAQGAVLASDAFFPFRDGIDHLQGTGIRAVIQPGGSVRDEEVIAACNEHGIAMMFTGKRCFRH
jgi:phosphoribosylaminoimidazolecarboxamide formyltransferase/IMP cyclohydrolase